MPGTAAQKRLLAGEFYAHRPARAPGEQRAEEFMLENVLLGSEAAAHVIDEHANLVERQAEHFGESSAHHEGRLRRSPDRQLAISVPLAGADIGLHIGRRRSPESVLALEDEIGLAKALFDVAPLDDNRRQDVVPRKTVSS